MIKTTLLLAATLILLSAASYASVSPTPDSLEFAGRIELYRYLQRGLEDYFDTGDPVQITRLEQTAAFVLSEYHDDFYLRQCRKFRRWRSDDFVLRNRLKQRFSNTLDQLAGSSIGADSLVRQMASLGDEFLAFCDSSSASTCWQNAAARSISSEAAGDLLHRSLQVCRLIGDLDATARTHNLVAGYLSERMEFIRAGAYFDSARVLKAELDDIPGVADGLNNIASVYLTIGDKPNALRYARECLAIRRSLNDSSLVYQSIISMIPAFSRDLPIDTLTTWLEEAASIDQASTRVADVGRLDYCRAVVAELQGSLDSAGVFFDRALDAASSSNNARAELAILQSSAALETSLGSYAKALEHYLRAENLAAKTRNRTALATIYHNLGALHQKLGDLESAISFYQRSLAIREQVDLRLQTGETLSNLSDLSLSVGDTASALNYASRAEEIARVTGDNRGLGNARIIRSRLLQLRGRHEQAISLLDSVGTISGGFLTVQRRFDLLCLEADFCRQSKNLGQAILLLNRADTLLDFCSTYSNSQRIDNIRSNIAIDRKEWQNAYNLLARVIARSERSRGTIPDPQLRGSFQTQTRSVYEQMVTALYHIRQSNRQRSFDDSLLFYIEKAKSRGLLDILASRGSAIGDSPDQINAAHERKLLREVEQLESSLADDSLPASMKRKLTRLNELEQALSDLRLKTNVAGAASQQVYSPNPVSVAKLQAMLPDNRTILLSYFLMPDTSYVLMISHNEFKVALLPSRAVLTNLVADYMRLIQLSIKDDNLLDSLDIVAGRLGRLLLPEPLLPHSCDRIFVSSDGVLSVLPLEAVKIHGKYLIEQSAVATLPSIFLFSAKLLISPKVENWRMLALADPKSDSRQRQLPFSALEVEWICSLFKPELCTILSASNATKTQLLRLRLADFQIIHAATHSTINYRDPTRSKIWLSSDTADVKTDNYLTLAEVDDLKLNSDLVVLSSCESGGGKLDYSEGMDGFVKAFMQAGARNMLVSLWEVEDFTTATFMKTFYQNLPRGYAEALQRAKLEMINSPRLRHRHPYYWSPFVLTLSPK